MTTQKLPAFLSTNQLRDLFLDYFRTHSHQIIPSSSLIPANDPTLLFTNAGMVQFKDIFLGKEKSTYPRAASIQRCLRAGGKHNDLENVGYTARHHTFFEMLGNFSFGDYFKREAIQFAWRFLTEVLQLPREKLWITVYHEDTEAADIWLNDIKIDPEKFTRCGAESNFWSMGPTGPCGSCTEIFYDHGEEVAGGPPGSLDENGDRYVEIWNIVFMKYDRAADGTLTPLPNPSVDTGMGLERIAAVMQGVHSNYSIDLFQTLIKATAALAGIHNSNNNLGHASLHVIADHIRSTAFLITDGVSPSNEGRGYVLRRIIRRALRHGSKLGFTEPFFYQLVAPLVTEMGQAYPELAQAKHTIEKIIRQEEEQFSMTLAQGLKLFDQATQHLKEAMIPGDILFKLYDTYGFPIDLTADIARERSLAMDYDGFEIAMNKQRERSRQASQFSATAYIVNAHIDPTEFLGYQEELLSDTTGKIIALYHDNQSVTVLPTGATGVIILDRTPFYAESGGQVGDQGILKTSHALFDVTDTQKQGQAFAHIGTVNTGQFQLGDSITAEINRERRAAIVLNHTATHLLHRVLRQVLGEHVIQKGSLVDPDRLRFDFAHQAPLTIEEINTIEHLVNQEIRANHTAIVDITSPEKAIQNGAIALFEEKYGDQVRVVRFGDSVELCGGTHAHHTGNIGLFKITSESGVAAGIRRLEAVTGMGALRWIKKREIEFKQKLSQFEDEKKLLEKQILSLKEKLAGTISQELIAHARIIHTVTVIVTQLDHTDTKSLRSTVDHLKNKLKSAIIVLASVEPDTQKISVIAGITQDNTAKIKAGELVNKIALQIGGKGGGRADLAEAGGNQPENLASALESIYPWIEEKLKN